MPELPEVETVRRCLARAVRGERLVAVVFGSKALRHPVPRTGLEALVGGRLVELRRRGKVLLLDFLGPRGAPPTTALVHLGMSGRVLTRSDGPGPELESHEHVRMRFEGRTVSFFDPRRFGSIELAPTEHVDAHPRVRSLGPEPLDAPGLGGAGLFLATRRRRVALRNLLLDGRVVAGLGNIYANEACFRAGVRPGRAAGRISRREADRLADAIRWVLTRAVEAGGTTLEDGGYVDSEGRSGWFQLEVGVYGRAGEPCRSCATPIRSVRLGQRSAFFCPVCQR